jgi:hypothetical protein
VGGRIKKISMKSWLARRFIIARFEKNSRKM